jgi:integrase
MRSPEVAKYPQVVVSNSVRWTGSPAATNPFATPLATRDLALIAFIAAAREAKLPRRDAETGRPRCTPHGLRRSAAIRFADRGATVPQLMAWFGWKTPEEAIRYVEGADRRKAAKAAADKLRERKRTTKVSNSKSGLTK